MKLRPISELSDREGAIPQLIRIGQCSFRVTLHQYPETFGAALTSLAQDVTAYTRLGYQARILFDQRFVKSYEEKARQRVIAEAMHQA